MRYACSIVLGHRDINTTLSLRVFPQPLLNCSGSVLGGVTRQSITSGPGPCRPGKQPHVVYCQVVCCPCVDRMEWCHRQQQECLSCGTDERPSLSRDVVKVENALYAGKPITL